MTAENRERKGFEFKDILHEIIPCWYELGWRKKKPAIILRVHNDFIKNTRVMPSDAPIVKSLMDEFKLLNFSGDFGKDIGFDQAFKRRGEKGGFTEFVIEIPTIKRHTDEICDNCGGSGRDDDFDRKCFHCDGTGREYAFDWHQAYAISASLTVFTLQLRYYEKGTSALHPQLMTVETITRKGMHGGSLGGEISIPLRQYLSSVKGCNTIPEMLEAMKTAYGRMLCLQKYDRFRFRVDIREN